MAERLRGLESPLTKITICLLASTQGRAKILAAPTIQKALQCFAESGD